MGGWEGVELCDLFKPAGSLDGYQIYKIGSSSFSNPIPRLGLNMGGNVTPGEVKQVLGV